MMPEEEDEEEAKEIEEIDALWKCCKTFRRLCEVSFSGSVKRMSWEWLWRLLFEVAMITRKWKEWRRCGRHRSRR